MALRDPATERVRVQAHRCMAIAARMYDVLFQVLDALEHLAA